MNISVHILFITYIILDYCYSSFIEELGVNMTIYLQSKANIFIDLAMRCFSFFGYEPPFLFIIAYLWMAAGNKVQVLKFIFVICLITFLMSILKLAYHVLYLKFIINSNQDLTSSMIKYFQKAAIQILVIHLDIVFVQLYFIQYYWISLSTEDIELIKKLQIHFNISTIIYRTSI